MKQARPKTEDGETDSGTNLGMQGESAPAPLRDQIRSRWLDALAADSSAEKVAVTALRDALSARDTLDRDALRAIVDAALSAKR